MGVFDRYKSRRKKADDKKRVDEKVWAKAEDNKIYLEKSLNDELLKSFFSGNKVSGVFSHGDKNPDGNYEGEKRAAMYEAGPATIQSVYDDINLNGLFPEQYSEDKNHYFSIEYDNEGNIENGISIKRKFDGNSVNIKVWLIVDGKEERANFVDTDPEDIKDWIETTTEELQEK